VPSRLVVTGCRGRMGSLLIEEALKDPTFDLVGAIERAGHPDLGQPLPQRPSLAIVADLARTLKDADVLIEFTTPEATVANAELAASAGVPMVIGTTGLSEAQLGSLAACARRIPIFRSPNMSIGILMLDRMIKEAANVLKVFELHHTVKPRIVEIHHAQKKDAPSGTAKFLAANTGGYFDIPADPDHIPIESKREGEVAGIHTETIRFGDERIALEHEALSRRAFARGALLVARFMVEHVRRRAGQYDMETFYECVRSARSQGR